MNDDRERVDDPKRCTDDDDARETLDAGRANLSEWKMKDEGWRCMLKKKTQK